MAATYILAAGRIHPTGADVTVDWRLAELLQWKQEGPAELSRKLPLFADIIVWLENHGYVVDLITGEVERMTPLQEYVDYHAELDDIRDEIDEEEWRRHGCP
jgi:hypothetical protein